MMDEVSVYVGLNFPEILDSRFVAQTVNHFLFPWEEEMGSEQNPKAKCEDEGFSETMTPRAAQQPLYS